jgi:hypothetical protein
VNNDTNNQKRAITAILDGLKAGIRSLESQLLASNQLENSHPAATPTWTRNSELPDISRCHEGISFKDMVWTPDQTIYYPTGTEVEVYIGSTTSCRGIAKALHPRQCAIFKVGIHTSGQLLERRNQLRHDEYAAYNGRGEYQSGYDNWDCIQLPANSGLAIPNGCLVTLNKRAIRVTLPATMNVDAFEKALRFALTPIALHIWATSPEGLEYLQSRNLDHAEFMRQTRYEFSPQSGFENSKNTDRVSAVTELYFLKPKRELPVLVGLICQIISDHLAAQLGSLDQIS